MNSWVCSSDRQQWSYLSRGGFASEKLVIERAVRRVELGLEKNAAIGYCFKRGGTFVGETKANKELEQTKKKSQKFIL